MIVIKRIYEEACLDDGHRVLVDRIWPRGISKVRAALDEWAVSITPTTELRKWFGHKAQHWEEFRHLYTEHLNTEALQPDIHRLISISKQQKLTLLYAAKSETQNHALVLRDYMQATLEQAEA